MTMIIIIFLCGILAMFVEIFIPGMVIGLLGLLAIVGSIVYAFGGGHVKTGIALVICALAFVPVFFVIWKSMLGRLFSLKGTQVGFRPSTTIGEDLVGLEGEATTLLRPSGIARLNDKRYDVVTRGEMLGKGTRIKVIEVSGNRIVVKAT